MISCVAYRRRQLARAPATLHPTVTTTTMASTGIGAWSTKSATDSSAMSPVPISQSTMCRMPSAPSMGTRTKQRNGVVEIVALRATVYMLSPMSTERTQIDLLVEFIQSKQACLHSAAWLQSLPPDTTLESLYATMGEGNGMMIGWAGWLASQVLPHHQTVALLLDVIRTVEPNRSTPVNLAIAAIEAYMANPLSAANRGPVGSSALPPFDGMDIVNAAQKAMYVSPLYAHAEVAMVERNMVAAVDRVICVAAASALGIELSIGLRSHLALDYLSNAVRSSPASYRDASQAVAQALRTHLPWAAVAGPLGAAIGCNLITAEGHADAAV